MPEDEARAQVADTDLDREVANSKGRRFTVRELRGRVTMAEENVVLLREVEDGSIETLTVMGDALEELVEGRRAYSIVIDLAEVAGGTTAIYRKFIPEFFNNIQRESGGAFRHLAVAFYGNPVARIASKFIIARMLDIPFSIHANRAAAVQAARAAIQ